MLTNRGHSNIIRKTEVYTMNVTDRELIDRAKTMLDKAYVPYSEFHVGAALLDSQGNVFTGCNVENSSYGCACCAERTAVFKAVSEGSRSFEAIAIVSSAGGETYPCGICRQVLSEFAPKIRVILENNDGELVTYTLDELLPHSFSL
ncbi:MAG: cytidine deaminase [Oscillospiraceae bacterium]|nr:cytidine deaminase [Oscillospiraceae bacterium]